MNDPDVVDGSGGDEFHDSAVTTVRSGDIESHLDLIGTAPLKPPDDEVLVAFSFSGDGADTRSLAFDRVRGPSS